MDRTATVNMVKNVIGAGLRIWLGWQWFTTGAEKVGSAAWTGNQAGTAITGFLKGALAKTQGAHPDVQPFYANFIQHFALPHAKLLSYLVAYGEVLAGIGLILGCLTTIALLGAVLMNFNYLLAGAVSVNPIWLLAGLVLLWLHTSGYFGVDGLYRAIRERFANDGNVPNEPDAGGRRAA